MVRITQLPVKIEENPAIDRVWVKPSVLPGKPEANKFEAAFRNASPVGQENLDRR